MSREQIIVVGTGGAGLACAITAADRGASVVAIERATEIGGALHVAGGKLSAAGTRLQRQRGIEDSPDAHFDDVMRLTDGEADPILVRVAVEEAASTVDWLEDLGFPFDPQTPALASFHEPYSVPRVYWGPGPVSRPYMARTLLEILRPEWDRLVARGAIEPRMGVRMESLAAVDGRVTGVHVRGADGAETIHGSAVVLACGGYSSDAELFAQLTPGAPRPLSLAGPGCTGDGLLAARAIGAAVRNTEMYRPGAGAIETTPGSGLALPEFVRLAAQERMPREIHVNARGERFRAEDQPSSDSLGPALEQQPGGMMWIVFDERALSGEGSIHMTWDAAEIRRRATEGTQIWCGDSLDELARRAGIDPAGLLATAQQWNESVRSGHDPLGRAHLEDPLETAPFYAIPVRVSVGQSPGGLWIDAELRVLDTQGQPIPGLYAAGEVIGSGATMGRAAPGGMMITPALSFGRILGRVLAPAAEPAGRTG